ncbi:hypothetical protein [Persephonella sp.]
MMRKIIFTLILAVIPFTVYPFPVDHMGQGGQIPLDIPTGESQEQMLGCIGDCAACHSLTPVEAQTILGQKFDVKKVLHINIKNGYFEVEYEDSNGEKKKINLLFSKDKACKEIIHLDK